jgi:hypothetical protein
MLKLLSCVLVAAFVATASPATAGELKLSIANGRATLIASDVPVRQVLAEWARIGETKVVNGDRVLGPNLTIQLIDRPEREVLDAVLRTVAGYVAAPRSTAAANLSVYDRILILPTSQAPAFNPAAVSTPTFTPAPRPMPMPDEDPVEHPNVMPPGANMPPGTVPQLQPQQPQMQTAPTMPQTLPRPGMLPPPPQGTPNIYNPNAPGMNPNIPGMNPNAPGVRPTGPGGTLPPGVKPPGGGGGEDDRDR